MNQMKYYIYMDMEGIESLCAQIMDAIVVEQEVETKKRVEGTASGAFSVKLNELFNTDVCLAGEGEATQSQRFVFHFPNERKLKLLQDYVLEHENTIKEYGDIKLKYQPDKPNFVYFTTTFDTALDCNNYENLCIQTGKFGYCPFYKAPSESIDSYEYSDFYYKNFPMYKTKITMNLNIQKMRGLIGMGVSSHLYSFLRLSDGHNIPLGVFGHIFKLKDDLYQIKPYAVWRV